MGKLKARKTKRHKPSKRDVLTAIAVLERMVKTQKPVTALITTELLTLATKGKVELESGMEAITQSRPTA